MALALVYDPRYHDFQSWAALMCEAYAGQQLAIPSQQTDWREWAAGLKAIDVFANEAYPARMCTRTGKTGRKPWSEPSINQYKRVAL